MPKNNLGNFLDRWINELRCATQLFEINCELAEIFEVLFSELIEYYKKHNIFLQDLSGTKNLLHRAEALFNQIAKLKSNPESVDLKWLSDESLHEDKSDGELTEPIEPIYKGGLVSAESKRALN